MIRRCCWEEKIEKAIVVTKYCRPAWGADHHGNDCLVHLTAPRLTPTNASVVVARGLEVRRAAGRSRSHPPCAVGGAEGGPSRRPCWASRAWPDRPGYAVQERS